MHLAVIRTGGKQYIVKVGDTLRVEKLDVAEGKSIKFDPLLVASEDGGDVKVGAPAVKGASVSATVMGQGRGDKVVVIKYKPKVRYKRKAGHRQLYTSIRIEAIQA